MDKEVEENIVREINLSEVVAPEARNWLALNGDELLQQAEDNGLFWGQIFSQYAKVKLNLDIDPLFAFMFFANAIEVGKKVNFERQKVLAVKKLGPLSQKYGFSENDDLAGVPENLLKFVNDLLTF